MTETKLESYRKQFKRNLTGTWRTYDFQNHPFKVELIFNADGTGVQNQYDVFGNYKETRKFHWKEFKDLALLTKIDGFEEWEKTRYAFKEHGNSIALEFSSLDFGEWPYYLDLDSKKKQKLNL